MAEYPRITIRISPEIDEWLTLIAKREGVSRSRIVQNALKRHIANQPTNGQ